MKINQPNWNKNFSDSDLTLLLEDLIRVHIQNIRAIDISIIRVQLRKFILAKLSIEQIPPIGDLEAEAKKRNLIEAKKACVNTITSIASQLGIPMYIRSVEALVNSVNILINEFK